MNSLPTGIVFAGIIVTLIILWYSLRRYEGHFSERKLFLSFLAGIAMGFVIIVLEFVTSDVGLLYIILFPAVEQFSKLMIMNLKTFQKKREAPFYGLSIGLGFGAIFVPLSTLMITTAMGTDVLFLIISLLFGIGVVLFHGATGCMLGYGVASIDERKKWRYLVLAILAGIPIAGLEFGLLFIKEPFASYIGGVVPLYGALLYWRVTDRFLPLALKRRERRKIKS